MTTRLKTVSTSAGFLEDCPVEFAPGLTCIIGARGTCKSTLIESVRFAFETDPRRAATLVGESPGDERAPTFGIIKETLRAGSVRCEVSRADGAAGETAFTLEREAGADTRIFVDGVREHADRDVLRGIEVFSQGDLQRIAEDDNDDLRLALIDRPHKSRVAALQRERGEIADQLREIGPRLRQIRAELSTLRHEVTQLDTFKSELNRLTNEAPAASPELEAERERFEHRQQLLRLVRSLEEDRAEMAQHLASARPIAGRMVEAIDVLAAGASPELPSVDAPFHALGESVKAALRVADELEDMSLQEYSDALHRRFEEASETYYQLRQQEKEVNEALKQQQALRRQVEHLEQKRNELDRATVSEGDFLAEREKLRAELSRIDDELYELRVTEIDAINREHGDTVQLTLGSSWNSRAYADRLCELLSGSRIRSQEDVAASMAERVEPSALVDLVESGDAQRLASLLGRDIGQMTRVVAHLSDHIELYDLETELPSSRLEITLFDEGQPKPVETLSKGQRATALLPIILRPLPYPLLFDQPEDDLDNKFIFQSLISTLRELKSRRQLIFVTHNANIPVLGGADRVLVMHMASPTRAARPLVGTVDERKQDILELLEGGADAFAQRERYYHDLLASGEDHVGGDNNATGPEE